jgi:hypothetical protein
MKNVGYTFLAKNGREFEVELSASIVEDPSGNTWLVCDNEKERDHLRLGSS